MRIEKQFSFWTSSFRSWMDNVCTSYAGGLESNPWPGPNRTNDYPPL